MGKASREKWENRLLWARTSLHQAPPPDSEKPRAISWIGRAGITSTLLGGVGLMQTFFWPSVTAVYLGIVLLLADAHVSKHRSRLTPWIVTVLLVVAVASFTKIVVLREDLIGVWYSTQMNGRIDFYIANSTTTDYRDLDVHVEFPSGLYIKESSQLSNFATCSVLDLPDGAAALRGEQAHESVLSTPDGNTVLHMTGNFRRVRCEVLPHRALLRIGLMPADASHPDQTPAISHVRVVGSYKGRFREFDVDTAVPFQPPNPGRYGWSQHQ